MVSFFVSLATIHLRSLLNNNFKNIPAYISCNWFLFAPVLRVWDVLLFQGNRVMLFRTALALMELYGTVLSLSVSLLLMCVKDVYKLLLLRF